MNNDEMAQQKERTKHLQGKERIKKEQITTQPINITSFQNNSIYKIKYEAI
jgi:hypothetical protein